MAQIADYYGGATYKAPAAPKQEAPVVQARVKDDWSTPAPAPAPKADNWYADPVSFPQTNGFSPYVPQQTIGAKVVDTLSKISTGAYTPNPYLQSQVQTQQPVGSSQYPNVTSYGQPSTFLNQATNAINNSLALQGNAALSNARGQLDVYYASPNMPWITSQGKASENRDFWYQQPVAKQVVSSPTPAGDKWWATPTPLSDYRDYISQQRNTGYVKSQAEIADWLDKQDVVNANAQAKAIRAANTYWNAGGGSIVGTTGGGGGYGFAAKPTKKSSGGGGGGYDYGGYGGGGYSSASNTWQDAFLSALTRWNIG